MVDFILEIFRKLTREKTKNGGKQFCPKSFLNIEIPKISFFDVCDFWFLTHGRFYTQKMEKKICEKKFRLKFF